MNEPHDPNRTVAVPSAPPDSLDAGLAAGFGRPASGPSNVPCRRIGKLLGDLDLARSGRKHRLEFVT
jgi:hypothetical protein